MGDSLYSLCKVCKIDEPKYCCPRCSTRTCGIKCYQKHQKRSQCNGKRDPAAYISAKDLATPAGIDRDFNFLTSVERAFDAADRDTQEKGLAVPQDPRSSNGPRSSLLKALSGGHVNVVRAPRGMKRQRDNSTDWDSRRKRIRWTIEWVYTDGRKHLSSSSETQTLHEAYENLLTKVKAKRSAPDASDRGPYSKRVREGNKSKIVGQDSEETEQPVFKIKKNDPSVAELQDSPQPPGSDFRPDVGTASEETRSTGDHYPSAAHVDFYLHRPQTSSACRVLIAITNPQATTLSSLLQGRTVLEFPTIYIFEKSYPLPDAFITDEVYEKQRKKLVEEIEHDEQVNAIVSGSTVSTRLGSDGASVSAGFQNDTQPYGDSKVMESLQRDLEWVSQFAE